MHHLIKTTPKDKIILSTVFVAIAFPVLALYTPFISNELIFDDLTFFLGGFAYSYYATTPFDLSPRTLPFFSFAFIQATTQSYEVQRLFNIGLHILNAFLIFLLLKKQTEIANEAKSVGNNSSQKYSIALSAGFSLCFALHPVAVYGVGYLTQRTILFATLFSLLALLKLLDALRENSWPSVFWATIASIAAMFSKEHAVSLPFAAAILLFAHPKTPTAEQIRKVATYSLSCIPFVVWLIFRLRHTVAVPYESHATLYVPTSEEHLWLRSALTQCQLYFQYLRLWIVPDISLMSIDIRVHFPERLLSPTPVLGGALFLSLAASCAYLLFRHKRWRLFAFGILYTQILFLVELSTVRIEEPFVLYRSYFWAPGVLLGLLNLALLLSRKFILGAFALILPILAYQSLNRLESISTSKNAWSDAQSKLASDELPGAFRIYYNRGVQYLRTQEYELALTDFVTCNRLNSSYAGCFSGQAAAFSKQKKFAEALSAIDAALKLSAANPGFWESKGKLHEALGQSDQAVASYSKAEALGGSITTLIRNRTLAE